MKLVNVVIDDDGECVFLVDFGGVVVVVIDFDLFGLTVVGIFGYMASETFMGGLLLKSD